MLFRSFQPPIRGSFHLPSRYLCTIGQSVVLSLGGWSPHIQTGFHVSRLTQGLNTNLLIQGYHLLWRWFPTASNFLYPATGLVRFRSPLLSESRLISFPLGTEMFQFPRFASATYVFSKEMTGHNSSRVAPFGHPRIIACLAAPRGFSQPTASFIAS